MPVFKNEDNGTWYVMARYVNWKGERKQKCKRGFATKKEAQKVLSRKNSSLNAENAELKEQNRDYKLLRKVFGSKQIDGLLEQAKQSKQRDKRFRDNQNER